jgi:NADPH-dependent 7-cyano-7-deazaguanine reductase QueF
MAITAHYIIETTASIKLKSRLIAFRHVPGTHEGSVIGNVFVDVLDELKIKHKIGLITVDNASNNNTMMAWIEDALTQHGIPFDRLQNRLR